MYIKIVDICMIMVRVGVALEVCEECITLGKLIELLLFCLLLLLLSINVHTRNELARLIRNHYSRNNTHTIYVCRMCAAH